MNEKEQEFTELELEVARALDELAELVRESDRREGILRWGRRRRRSGPSGEDLKPPLPENRKPVVIDSRSSPTTPLSFSPSADEYNYDVPPPPPPPPLKKASRHKKVVVELIQKVEGLSADNEILKRWLEKKRGELERLRLLNQRLKAIKLQLEITRPSHRDLIAVGPIVPQPQMVRPTAAAVATMEVAREERIPAPVPVAESIRMQLPDLNAAVEETEVQEQSLMMTKTAICAQARKFRREKQREKNNHYYRSSSSPSSPAAAAAAASKKRHRVSDEMR